MFHMVFHMIAVKLLVQYCPDYLTFWNLQLIHDVLKKYPHSYCYSIFVINLYKKKLS